MDEDAPGPIANPDKHRRLTPLTAEMLGTVVTIYPPGHAGPGRRLPSGQILVLNADDVVRAEGAAVGSTLRRLQTYVNAALANFKRIS